jgi:hypothetical protein
VSPGSIPDPTPYSLRWVFQDYLLDRVTVPAPIRETVEAIMAETLTHDTLGGILERHGISREAILPDLLDLVLYYAEFSLVDHELSPGELATIRQLKRVLRVEEGELWMHHRERMARVVLLAVERILADRAVSRVEELHQVELQAVLDLGYDQFVELVTEAVAVLYASSTHSDLPALLTAVQDLNPLVAVRRVVEAHEDFPQPTGRMVSPGTQRRVFARDGGRCAKCGSRERLHFDHIIPYSWGGSNEYGNIQLLCETCNLQKGASLD